MRVLITGAAGFIGYHTAATYLDAGAEVIGVDALSDYYDPELKRARLDRLAKHDGFTFHHAQIEDEGVMDRLAQDAGIVIHLAAQAGVRYSIDVPESYVTANLLGTFRVLEAARAHATPHLLLASTSSVYGANRELPFRETAKTDMPMSFYAATKKAGEAMAHSYSHLYGIPMTALRFFTVYGPWGRPDMALFKFTRAMLAGEEIEVYGEGNMSRDFSYVDDIVTAIRGLADVPPETGAAHLSSELAPYRVVNIGNESPVKLMDFISALERALGTPAKKRMLPLQPGDMVRTWSDTSRLKALTGLAPQTPVDTGVARFVQWYRDYYEV